MEGFLEEILGLNGYVGESQRYNRDFFDKYVNKEVLFDLLKLSHIYISIVHLLEDKNSDIDIVLLEKLKEEKQAIDIKVESIKNSQLELCDNKEINDNARKGIYQSSEIDFDKIKELELLDSRIDTLLKDNDIKLNAALLERKNKTAQIEKISDRNEKINSKIENYISELNQLFIVLNEKDITVFNNLDVDAIKNQYETGLTSIIGNTQARKAYVSYIFDILKRESEMLPQIFATAKQYVNSATREKDFNVSELNLMNNKISLTESATFTIHDNLRQFADIFCRNANDNDKSISTIGNGYLGTQLFIDGIYSYINNLETYDKDISKANLDYQKLHDYNNQLYAKLADLQSKDSRKLINIVNRVKSGVSGRYQSIEREPYEFATRIFDDFNRKYGNLDRIKEQLRNFESTTKNDCQPEVKSTPLFEEKLKSENLSVGLQVIEVDNETLDIQGKTR